MVLLRPATEPAAAGENTCTVNTRSTPGADVSLLALGPNNGPLLYYDATTQTVTVQPIRTSGDPITLETTFPNATRLQSLNTGDSAAVTLADGRLQLFALSNPNRVVTLTDTLIAGPVENPRASQFAFTALDLADESPGVQLVRGFFGGEFPVNEVAALRGNVELFTWEQLAFVADGFQIVSLIRTPLDWEMWSIGGDGTGTEGPYELGADNDQPAQMRPLTGDLDNTVLLTYVTRDGDTVLTSFFPADYVRRAEPSTFSRTLSNTPLRIGQPVLQTAADTLIFAEQNPAGGYTLVRNTPDATQRTVLAQNLSAACYDNPLCSLYRLVGDEVVYRGVTEDGQEGFFAVSVSGATPAPRLLLAGTRALVFYGVDDVLVYLEPLRVDSGQVVFSLNRLGLDGAAADLVPGLRWPVDVDFQTDAVQFSGDGATMVYVSNPGLATDDFRLFRMALSGEEGFPRRVTDTPLDIFRAGQPFWLTGSADHTFALGIDDSGQRVLLDVACGG